MTDQEYEETLDRVKFVINLPLDNRNNHRYNDRVVQLEEWRKCRNNTPMDRLQDGPATLR